MLSNAKARPERNSDLPHAPHENGAIDLGRIEGRLKKSSIKKVGEIVDKHPDKALSIVRNWLHEGH